MTKYIDADKFLLDNDYFADRDFINPRYSTTLRDLVDDAPAADVEPVRHGRWIETDDIPNIESNRIYRCSVCGYADEQSPTTEVPYCWHCGSRMRKMQKEDRDATY